MVVLGTLIIQGLTIKLLIKFLQIKPGKSLSAEISLARTEMIETAIARWADERRETVNTVLAEYEAVSVLAKGRSDPQANTEHDRLRMKAIAARRWRKSAPMAELTTMLSTAWKKSLTGPNSTPRRQATSGC